MNTPTRSSDLPEISPETLARLEKDILHDIAMMDQAPAPVARRRSRPWLSALGVAAAFVVGVAIVPVTGQLMAPQINGADGAGSPVYDSATEASTEDADFSASSGGATAADSADPAGREIVRSAEARVRVAAIRGAVEQITALTTERGGFVESTSVSDSPATELTDAPELWYEQSSYVSLRVPSAQLADLVRDLDTLGTVESSWLSKQDVTTPKIDLEAQVTTLTTSVERLTSLMAQTTSVSDLVALETALSERQALLQSATQQLSALDDQIAMSSLHVTFVPEAAPQKADPAGFGSGLLAGWNGLVASANAAIVALGFALPWLGIGALVWGAVVLVRRRRSRRDVTAEAVD